MSFSRFTIKDNKLIKERKDRLMELAALRCPSPSELDMVQKALDFVEESHKNVRRSDGEPYIIHPIEVALIVIKDIGLGYKSICAALMHDVLEDTDYSISDINQLFGDTIGSLVEGLVKIKMVLDEESRRETPLTEERQADNLRKILLTLNDDVRVILIKLADRLHSCRTLASTNQRKRDKILTDLMYIFIPLAHRLGLYSIKSEMENTWLRYRQPEEYEKICARVNRDAKARDEDMQTFLNSVERMLSDAHINFTLKKRLKTPYSIWRKMQDKVVDIDQIYDLFAIRIIFRTPEGAEDREREEAFRILDLLKGSFKEKEDRRRNWLDNPKSNGYEALHCTLMTASGFWVEVQIRSRRMDDIAEKGIAAHWAYKKDGYASEENSEMDLWLSRLQSILAMKDTDTTLLLDMMHKGLYSPQILVFTQSGEQRGIVSGATALDFAYSIHSDIGNRAVAAKVNGRLSALSTILHSGDRVEIITIRKGEPSQEWLSFLQTRYARNKVAEYLRKKTKA
ncbi:MAG: bifunctional (p)ppGpp synthetase/guanosine-3',5'-bis(diphosphate) 3'-pyrophosphohydrolase [Bacteroidales bacterium]|nr:bifunctional (p)ppGpp synthetase/guanosine-3',5'-bis(diphosphate) 3'-pyrophosphohydrolase [Bacteroidales bacterium]